MSGLEGGLWDALEAASGEGAARPALRVGEESWTLAALLDEADAIADWLSSEGAGAALFLRPHSSLRSVTCLLGAIRAGAVPVLADAAWTEAELGAAMERCGARLLLCEDERETGLGELLVARDSSGPRLFARTGEIASPPRGAALGRFTSGSTGAPRCLAFSETAVLAAARGWAEAAAYKPDDEILCMATLNNGLGFNASLFPGLLSGACLILHPGRLVRSGIQRALAGRRPTVLVAFPFVFEQLVGGGDPGAAVSGLRLAISSAARLDDVVKNKWGQLGGPAICDYYGLAEVGPCTFNEDGLPGSLGRPLSGVRLKIVDERGTALAAGETGRVRIETPSMALAYLDPETPTFEEDLDDAGFYVSKDVGRLDEDGRLLLSGRVGRQVNIAGRKVEPSEIEAVLCELDGVRTAAVVAQPTSAGQSILAAYLEGEGLDRETVVAHCRQRLAGYKIPQAIHLVARLPRSSTGKVSIGALVGRAAEEDRWAR